LRADFTAHEYKPHVHDELVVAATERGGAVIKTRGVLEEAQPSALFVSNPEEPQSAWMGHSRCWRYRALYLNSTAMQEVAAGLGVVTLPRFTRNLLADRELIDSFLSLHRVLEAGRDPLHQRELLIDSFGRLFERHGRDGGGVAAAPKDRDLFHKVAQLMRDRYYGSLLLEDLASVVGLTAFQLIGLYKRVVGLTPHAYLTQLRLRAACRHIRAGMPIAEAAVVSGFCDQSALNRHFRQSYGITPMQLAKAVRC
jgi:AraC-like DNA-binding protein